MSQSNNASEHFGWKVYRVSPPELQEVFLKELCLDETLPTVTWRGQVSLLDGAPDDVILKYFKNLYWKAQVEMFEVHLSVSAHEKAIPLMDDRAKKALKIQTETEGKKPVSRWEYW